MGIFDFLKSKPKIEQPILEEVPQKELSSWAQAQKNEILKKLQAGLEKIKKEISEEKKNLSEKIEQLKNAEMRNKEIPERAKQIMEGNRETYVQKLISFTEKIDLPSDPEKIKDFFESFDKDLNEFDKSIARNHRVMEEFFGEKAGKITISMKKIDRLVKESIKELEKSDLKKIGQVNVEIEKFKEKIEKKENLALEIEAFEKILKKETSRIEKLEKTAGELKGESNYKESLESKEKIKTINEELSNLDSSFLHLFSEISPALKKYENLSGNKLVRRYLEDPLNAFLHDDNVEIITIISSIIQAIEKNEIELKDKKKDRICKELAKINIDYLNSFSQRRQDIADEIGRLKQSLNSTGILNNIESIEDELANDKIRLRESRLELHEKRKILEKTDIDELRKDLENEIKLILNKEVKII